MAKIDSRVTRVENDNAEMQQVKCKIANVASNKNVSINYGTDTMVDVLDNINNSTIPTPSGTLNITSNNTYDVTNYASANVNVPQGYPIEIDNANDMNAVLTADNVGKVYKYVGTTDTNYTNGDLYEVEASS